MVKCLLKKINMGNRYTTNQVNMTRFSTKVPSFVTNYWGCTVRIRIGNNNRAILFEGSHPKPINPAL